MNSPVALTSLLASAGRMLRDFGRFAGSRGISAGVLAGLAAVLENVGLALLVPILAVVTEAGKAGRLQKYANALFYVIGTQTQIGRLAVLMAAFAAALLLRAIVISARERTIAVLEIDFVEGQRAEIIRRLAAARWEQVLNLRHARIAHVLGGDVERIGSALHFLIQSGVAVLLLATECALMVMLSPAFASITLALLGLGLLMTRYALRRSYNLGSEITQDYLTLAHSSSQLLGGLKLAVSQNLQASFVSEFEETIDALKRRQASFAHQQANAHLVLTTAFGLIGAGVVLVGFGFVHMSAPVLITLLLIIGRMSSPAAVLQQGLHLVAHSLPAYEKVRELEHELSQHTVQDVSYEARNEKPFRFEAPITFRGVQFVYADAEAPGGVSGRGVTGVNVTIAPGEAVGISGPSGAGKTTFADLLVGLISPQEGTITVGGSPLSGPMLDGWRGRVSYVSQDPFLFHDTIRRNLLWANPRASEAELWDALAMAGADAFVREKANGLDTVVGERGILISGGERQRIGLARAVLRKPALLVLDEATSAIDIDGERETLARIAAMTPRPTIVVIAHRPEGLSICGRRLRFENGRLVDGLETLAGLPQSNRKRAAGGD